MPYGDMHAQQKKKNYVLLALILVLVILFFAVTLVKIAYISPSDEKPLVSDGAD